MALEFLAFLAVLGIFMGVGVFSFFSYAQHRRDSKLIKKRNKMEKGNKKQKLKHKIYRVIRKHEQARQSMQEIRGDGPILRPLNPRNPRPRRIAEVGDHRDIAERLRQIKLNEFLGEVEEDLDGEIRPQNRTRSTGPLEIAERILARGLEFFMELEKLKISERYLGKKEATSETQAGDKPTSSNEETLTNDDGSDIEDHEAHPNWSVGKMKQEELKVGGPRSHWTETGLAGEPQQEK